jgi:hypothetical protein
MPSSGKFLSLGDQKRKSNGTHTKDFCEENGLKSLDFQEFFFSSWNHGV